MQYVRWFKDIGIKDVAEVGGKNASLGEMFCHLSHAGVMVPNGFATTANAYSDFLLLNNLNQLIKDQLSLLDVNDLSALNQAGKTIREAICNSQLPNPFVEAIKQSYEKMQKNNQVVAVAVRSSATAEDLPEASFAGQQETYLNVVGIDELLNKIKLVYASLFTERAISYRNHYHFNHLQVKISVGIQHMVRSDIASSGVMFTIDTESGFDGVVFITSSFGLGELIVQGIVNPDEFYVNKNNLLLKKSAIIHKFLGAKDQKMIYSSQSGVEVVPVEPSQRLQFSLTDEEITQLGQLALKIEQHYKKPMDIEWAKDGNDGKLYIIQARPETVVSRTRTANKIVKYRRKQKANELTKGRSIGHRIGVGKSRIIKSVDQMHELLPGEILVADMTDPDWEPIMKRAGAIVTNRGGRTCHAAIVARELGIPAVVGCNNATTAIKPNQLVTVSCAEGEIGYIYDGAIEFEVVERDINHLPKLPVKLMLNLGNPEKAFTYHKLPHEGVGLARLEFIISHIGIHPQALLQYKELPETLRHKILEKIAGYKDPVDFYIQKLIESIATIATAFYPKPVIVRLSDFKSNEYASLLGGELFEPVEENPMIGFRGVSRYLSDRFKDCFKLECIALKYVREQMGFTNVQIMVPFVRTPFEAKNIVHLLDSFGLKRGVNELKIIMMCEIPSNVILAEEFLQYFDGFSIGSNDLTQLTLGIDRDSSLIASLFDERSPAILQLLSKVIRVCKQQGKYIGICGQGPSDYPEFAKWLIDEGIDTLSLNPDAIISTIEAIGLNAETNGQ